MTTLVTPHDPIGRRVQGVDEDLRELIQNMANSNNTLTVIFADHGNSYNDYVYTESEGRYEQYHPVFMMVVPDNVQKLLGHEAMKNLDIHHTIKHLIDPNHPRQGILQLLLANRTCGDIPMGMPNLCVCKGWDSPVKNSTELMPFVEFAVGQINNMISDASPTGKCKRLVPTSFENVMQRKQGDNVGISFDIITSPGVGSANYEERINAEVSYKKNINLDHFDAKLLSKDRISIFGHYRKCSDADLKFRFCVCDSDQMEMGENRRNDFGNLFALRNKHTFEMFGPDRMDEVVYSLTPGDDIGLLIRKTFDEERNLVTVTFEGINLTSNEHYKITIKFPELRNLAFLTQRTECTGTIGPRKMFYFCTLGRLWSVVEASFTYDISLKKL